MGRDKNLKREMHKRRKAFIKKFGREPTSDDPVFFDPDAETPQAVSLTSVQDAIRRTMLAAGSPPHLVYAYCKTGLMPTETSYQLMSPTDRAAYDAAIKEYFAMERAQGDVKPS